MQASLAAATDRDTFFLSRRVLYQTSSGVGSLPCHEYEYVLSANDMSNQDIANRARRDGTGNRQNGTLLRGTPLYLEVFYKEKTEYCDKATNGLPLCSKIFSITFFF